ncbi:putative serine/threonine-protein kinase-like protein CCR3 [Vigna unguiculata]|uniref:Diphosphoinositol-polyphosphate diphosphatase n=1 Tax=Vigna unguiculata TaxID=3917 RepID=A0A4D6ME27_VIGUN|nr:putative serine/threonine-protein kinase-like protein CCR3 [Vigna unguiculata]QCD98598.1 diphosphoinositol-polyphosphate diphosphatase [Vigna unguiculata]
MANSGASLVHSFASIVENALRSIGGDLGAFPLHEFSMAVENALRSIGGDLGAFPLHEFSMTVENALSSIGGDLGALPVHGYASAVENAMRSIVGDFRALPVNGFASTVENAMRSTVGDFRALPVHDFASTEENPMRSIGGDLGMSHSPVPGFQLYTLVELAAATDNFSANNTICAGSSSVVYIGKLVDGSEVAIERVETGSSRTPEEAFWWKRMCSSTFVPGLRPKNLVGLVGLCVEKDERVLVYECMKNGSLNDHLHDKRSNVLNSWEIRIKLALDASRGIEYLHKYGVPYTVHGDIKPSNILIDATWTAKVCNFGKKAGSIGYIDPEYSSVGVLTEKSDVYGFGVVLLELLTGKRAACGKNGGSILHVPFAEGAILGGDFVKILDTRIGKPHLGEAEAVELVAHTAINCVNVVGKVRPTIAQVVVNLERAYAYFLYKPCY